MLRTRTIDNDLNPKWNQSFNLLVDDLETQSLRAPRVGAAVRALNTLQAAHLAAVSCHSMLFAHMMLAGTICRSTSWHRASHCTCRSSRPIMCTS